MKKKPKTIIERRQLQRLKLGITRDQVEQRLGEPDATGKDLWAYGDLELFFYKGKLARISKKGITLWPLGI